MSSGAPGGQGGAERKRRHTKHANLFECYQALLQGCYIQCSRVSFHGLFWTVLKSWGRIVSEKQEEKNIKMPRIVYFGFLDTVGPSLSPLALSTHHLCRTIMSQNIMPVNKKDHVPIYNGRLYEILMCKRSFIFRDRAVSGIPEEGTPRSNTRRGGYTPFVIRWPRYRSNRTLV